MKVEEIIKKQEEWRSHSINLIASENVMSDRARRVYVNDFMHRYAEGKPGKRYYQGTRYADELEEYATELFKEVFGVKYADVRPISGVTANFSTFFALKRKGILAHVGLSSGAHISHELGAQVLGFRTLSLPFDLENWNVDVDGALKLLEKNQPDFVVLGASLYLFPHPVREISESGVPVVHDSAHVLGLHLGEFPDPLKEGATVLTASTHKTFPGPQGGVVLSDDDGTFKKIYNTTFPYIVSNHHIHRLASLAVTLEEMRRWGGEYARATVRNAKTLAEALHALGWKVVAEERGFTETHQVAVDVRDRGGGKHVAETLERANIILNKNMLPWDDNPKDPSGIRIGVQEMTRLGMGKGEMEYIAELMDRALKKPEEVKREVIAFRSEYQCVRFSFD
ncbi:MAG: aminotransferase class I/II-fold pyridoxal phosphate-dependent enzyme [Candidatus Diapherotrites archaeon]|nr:aminotransferase class I/II-fold pyridoxal phosphate-dependent enzyme [Candidatus Diapherotrites archaeon]